MRSAAIVLCVVLLLVLSASSTPAAAPKRITGKLSKPGYTLIALASNGRATSVRPVRASFSLRLPASTVTLSLRAPGGKYAGPVVVGGSGRRVFLGVRAGARLGTIDIRTRRGYAKLSRKLPSRWLDARRWARARKSVPIGAGNFGFVRSRVQPKAVRGDLDLDGVPDTLDVDRNGNLVLDNAEGSIRSRAAQAAGGEEMTLQPFLFVHAGMLEGGIFHVVNANALPVAPAEVDENLRQRGNLALYFPQVPAGSSAVLDCHGLVYCSPGGTGRIAYLGNHNDIRPYPDCCLDPETGLGKLQDVGGSPESLVLAHGATSADIGTGDMLIERVLSGGVEIETVTTLVQFVIATHPALASYDDRQGNNVSIAYPVRCGVNNPCDERGGFPVKAGANGVSVRFTFWRPQRPRTRGDQSGKWIDIGHLMYAARWADLPQWPGCPPDAYSELSTNLEPSSGRGFFGWAGVLDKEDDRPADRLNTFSYTLNMSRCLEANGGSFGVGETHYFVFDAGTENGDETTLGVSFTRQE